METAADRKFGESNGRPGSPPAPEPRPGPPEAPAEELFRALERLARGAPD